jgi:phycocyanin-associated rod protein
MKVSANSRSTGVNSDRQVSLTVTAMNNIDYSRTADRVMNIPFSRMRETMHLVHCLGGKITSVTVSGSPSSPISNSAPPRKTKKGAPEDN